MRHAMITAGTKGLGKKTAEKFLQKGCSVTVNYRNDIKRVTELQEEWKGYQERLQFVQGDMTKKEDIVRLFEEVMTRFGRIDHLVCNAGPFIFARKKLTEYSDHEWKEIIDGNLTAVYHLAKLSIPVMRLQNFGRIITYGFQDAESAPGWIYRSAFSAAKVGLVALTKTIALEEAEHGITANMICPGDIAGEMKEADIEFSRQTSDKRTPIGRSGTGEDIARLISFLCEDHSDMITGSVISITGGIDVVNRYRK
ncbi:SDR family oxidoreductase [Bacillus benzoevorans]|uniref:3-oxoacyl-[acyl-carrier protein] reductase n=1 Tax=Bacillus benzoevorans TaxID=1456 RepID=A0A7X0HSP7_9BACI|nr:SDR family oxidoreductase [Bacillus benzoevorans]MBB6446123.1 3-oxoacyl-[acyl-carrier protein] reductase [Bacillus benzoevorans]